MNMKTNSLLISVYCRISHMALESPYLMSTQSPCVVLALAPGWTCGPPGPTADLLLKQEPFRCPVPEGSGGSPIGLHI